MTSKKTPKRRRHGRRTLDGFPRFDPNPSMKAALSILDAAGVPFALAGRLAVWDYVPPEGQQFTKDVDFAVPHGHVDAIVREARRRGFRVADLNIGGAGIKAPHIMVDFIDRHPELSALFAEAVRAAHRQPKGRWLAFQGRRVPIVPMNYLIAMKLVTFEPKDERDVTEMLMRLPDRGYAPLRRLVKKHLGYVGAERLDVFARRVGHPGPGRLKRHKRAR
jgi:hypothetical protein